MYQCKRCRDRAYINYIDIFKAKEFGIKIKGDARLKASKIKSILLLWYKDIFEEYANYSYKTQIMWTTGELIQPAFYYENKWYTWIQYKKLMDQIHNN